MGKKKPATSKPPAKPPFAAYIEEDLWPLAVEIDSLVLDPENCRDHGEADVRAIAASLKRFKQRKPIVVNVRGDRVVEAGNGTVQAAKSLGWTHIAIVRVRDDAKTQLGFAVADNRTAELSEWNEARLMAAIAEIRADDLDLANDLLLDKLTEVDVAEDPPEVEVPPAWMVSVECRNEAQQKEVYELLKKKGYTVRVATM